MPQGDPGSLTFREPGSFLPTNLERPGVHELDLAITDGDLAAFNAAIDQIVMATGVDYLGADAEAA